MSVIAIVLATGPLIRANVRDAQSSTPAHVAPDSTSSVSEFSAFSSLCPCERSVHLGLRKVDGPCWTRPPHALTPPPLPQFGRRSGSPVLPRLKGTTPPRTTAHRWTVAKAMAYSAARGSHRQAPRQGHAAPPVPYQKTARRHILCLGAR
ncbi:hypothetical protein SKAU_G00395520 [Synaphobranchus kaupii]|uniref:Uncharacterized protein n=1 Tax=Synaphobranchus kaupii TaxID=118154 RepID=A0A9Q1IE20_SYNKA|nr:hypothetical protein SKAU_G00395520 [Synaphobranchus kaupii]